MVRNKSKIAVWLSPWVPHIRHDSYIQLKRNGKKGSSKKGTAWWIRNLTSCSTTERFLHLRNSEHYGTLWNYIKNERDKGNVKNNRELQTVLGIYTQGRVGIWNCIKAKMSQQHFLQLHSAIDWVFLSPPKTHKLKPNAQSDGIRDQAFGRCLGHEWAETPQSSRTLSTMWVHRKKAISEEVGLHQTLNVPEPWSCTS